MTLTNFLPHHITYTHPGENKNIIPVEPHFTLVRTLPLNSDFFFLKLNYSVYLLKIVMSLRS